MTQSTKAVLLLEDRGEIFSAMAWHSEVMMLASYQKGSNAKVAEVTALLEELTSKLPIKMSCYWGPRALGTKVIRKIVKIY